MPQAKRKLHQEDSFRKDPLPLGAATESRKDRLKRSSKSTVAAGPAGTSEAWKPKNPVLVLRTCDKDLCSYNGFQWPESGHVEAPDWSAEPICGKGLHGLAWGKGSVGYFDLSEDAKWLVFEADQSEVVEIGGDKHKARRGNVLFVGSRDDAAKFLYSHASYPTPQAVGNFGTATAGDSGTATAGYRGTATAGDSGNFGTATAGDSGTATAGDRGTARLATEAQQRLATVAQRQQRLATVAQQRLATVAQQRLAWVECS
jgi:hypothetical protein